jgi:RNA-directed DNA polymerase
VVMLLEAVYEQDFRDSSYGFRPGRCAHQALRVLWETLMHRTSGWVLELDIRKFFDTLDHGQLRAMVRQRVRDGVVLRLISKWLHAGVMEDGSLRYPEAGSPQGGVISPLLANVYLHEVLDTWFEQVVQPRLSGRARLVRYADDAVMVFAEEADARRVLAVLPKRFGKYGLALHPDKTRLVAFGPPRSGPDEPKPAPCGGRTFDFLGFTHYWGRTRKGRWAVKRKTASDRLSRFLRRLADWCRRQRHEPIRWQHERLGQKLRGHYTYYGLIGNSRCVQRVAYWADRIWRKWLSRRSDRGLSWPQFQCVLQRYPLPAAHVTSPQRSHDLKSRMRE